ncbi:MAG: LpqB family beta-propeller domain-containing protein [Pyrinomonadaceae bacterium]
MNQTKRRNRAARTFLPIFIVALTGLIYGLYRFATRPTTVLPFREVQVTKLTTEGRARHAAISPDGKYVAFVTDEGGRQSLTIKQIASNGAASVVPPTDVKYMGVTFSHDGNHIYFVTSTTDALQGTLHSVPAIGGPVKQLMKNLSSPVTLSPDDTRLAFVREYPAQGESVLMVANTDGSGERRLAFRKKSDFFALEGPAWSPDGKLIACSVVSYRPAYREDLIGVRVADGTEEVITTGWTSIQWVTWLKDGLAASSSLQQCAKRESICGTSLTRQGRLIG